jgi:PAS domain S-box-containing protein
MRLTAGDGSAMNRERRIAEEALRESEQSWRSLTEALPQLVWSATPDGACDYFSTQWTEYTGVAESELLGWRWMDVLHPDDRHGTRQFWMDSVAGRRPYDVEYRVRRSDGAYGWFKTRGVPIRDGDGNIVKWFGTCTDITDGKRTEEALRQREQELWKARSDLERKVAERTAELRRSEAYLAEAQRLTRTGSWAMGVANREIVHLSAQFYQIFGLDPEGGIPSFQTIRERIHPDDLSAAAEVFRTAIRAGKRFEMDHRIVLPDGAVRFIHSVAHPVFNTSGNPVEFVGTVMDVTERKRAEGALRESESYLAEAQRLSHTGSLAWVPATGESRYWSEECFRVIGFDPAEVPPPFEAIFQRIHPDDQARMTGLLEQATRDRDDFTLDFRVIHPDGETRDIHLVAHPALSASGDLAEFVGTVIDVTERKQADEERQAHLWFLESMDKVNRAIQGANDLERMTSDVLDAVLSIFACDRAWLVYPCDPDAPSWRATMEHTRPGFPGAFALGTDLPMDAEVANVFQTARASSGVVQFGAAADHPVPAQLAERFAIKSLIGMAVCPKVDKPYMFGLHECSYPRLWTAREQRLFQEVGRRMGDALTGLLMLRNLRESEGKLEEAQRVAHVGYWERDLATDLITWSDEGFRIFGLAPGQSRVPFKGYQELIHAEDRQRIVAAVAEALRGGSRYDVEYRLVRPDGQVRIVHSQGDVMRDESGRPRRMFGIVQDVTERKQADENLRESERRYREAQMQLAHVNRLTTMGQLMASIAHEVNQPIATAVTSANAGLRWLAARPPNLDEVRNAFDLIIKAGNQAGEVIGRNRALIKKVPAQKAALDINETILETIALAGSEMRRHCVLLQTDLANDLPRVWGDRVHLQQVTLNLIMNAIEAMSEVSEASRELLIGTRVGAPDGVIVSVWDSGPGLKPESLDRLFDPFYTTKPGGMGMGLSICRSIVEAHGGRLWATANAPRGAVFQFTLPRDDAA